MAATLAVFVFSQTKNNPWQDVPEASFATKTAERQIIPSKYRTLALEQAILDEILTRAPMRFSAEAAASQPALLIPMPDGSFENFKVVEAPVMHTELAAKYPYIRSFAGWSREDPTAYLRCGITQKGFHAVIFSARHSTVYIDVFAEGDTEHYISYFKKDFYKNEPFECLVDEVPENKTVTPGFPAPKMTGDCKLRTYALALACTGEYAQFHGGTIPAVMAAYNIAMTRINGIYEREASATMELVPNTDLLIFLNASTDPYTNGNGSAMLSQNQTTCNNIIGNANYDIGHVFSTGGGGVAFLNSVCSTNNKARGVTGQSTPTGDPFWVDYVAHEMGHQFGGNHTQNNSCNRNGATAMEPGSASTIMGYAGICSPNVQNNSDDYFHAINLDEIASHVTGFGNSCATTTITGNSAPTVTVPGGSYNVPVSTPIVLTADATDPDGDVLTYCWEQMDNQVGQMPPQPTNTGGPAFRSLLPQESPSRYLPNLPAVIGGSTPTWEVLPSVSRTMFFRCTVRDNHPGAGCTNEADVILNFTANAGPFRVSDPNVSSVVWNASSPAIVTWDVANTDLAPVNCSQVDILLSIDGGFTYPFTLLSETPNDGSQTVVVPNVTSSQARVMVRSRDNVFYDISNQNFTIAPPAAPTFFMIAEPPVVTTCKDGEAGYTLTLESIAGFNETLTLSATGVPASATFDFSIVNPVPPATVMLTVSDLQNTAAGTYPITVTAVSASVTQSTDISLVVLDSVTSAVTLSGPANGAAGQVFGPSSVNWEAVTGASEYAIEVSTNPSFQNLFHSAVTGGTSYQVPGTEAGQIYYWRVKGMNICNEGDFSQTFAFQTAELACEEFFSANTPVPIPSDTVSTVFDTISVPNALAVASTKVNLDISHTYTGDLKATLTSPQGSMISLFDQPGVPATTFGCSNDDLLVSFYDDAANTAADFENTCNSTAPSISGDYQPIQPLGALQGQPGSGNWILTVEDVFDEDGGAINEWSVEICAAVSFPPAVLIKNDTLVVILAQTKAITDAELLVSGNSPALNVFTLLSLPEHGVLYLQGDSLEIGSTFTQEQVNSGLLTYEHDGNMTGMDSFTFDLLNEANGWLHGQVFHIQIIENTLAASAALTQAVDCNNGGNAIITVTVAGGVAPFEFALNGGSLQPSPVFENLIPGTYSAEVVDATGFTVTTNDVTISNPATINASATVDDDDITVNASGGTGVLQYSINGGAFQSSNIFQNMPNGDFTITVQDENGCNVSVMATVAVNTLVVTTAITHAIDCFNGNEGEITTSVNGGNPPYEYSLNGGAFQSGNVFQNLSAGTYTVTVLDGDGFTQTTLPLTLSNPAPISGSATVTGYTVEVMANGGTGSLEFSLDGGDFQASNTFSPVLSGNHTVTIQDQNGCETSFSFTVNIPALGASAVISQNLPCWDSANGEITATGTGGVSPYEYSLNGGAFQSSNIFSNLVPGDYEVTIRDVGGFTAVSAMVTLTAPPVLVVMPTTFNKTVTVSASGGTPPYQYQLDGGPLQSSNIFEDVQSGTYLVNVVDANGCEMSADITVTNIAPPAITIGIDQELACFGDENAAISVQVSGGVPPFQFSLNGGTYQPGNVFAGLPAGTFTVEVQDADGDIFAAPGFEILSPAAVNASVSAFGTLITVTASGGTGNLMYSFAGGAFQSSNEYNAPANGTYAVSVVDENGCIVEIDAEVNIVEAVQFDVNSPSCPGLEDGIIVIQGVTGGIPPYLYSLNGGPFTASLNYPGLVAGEYIFTVQDATGYQFEAPAVTIEPPVPLEATMEIDENNLTIVATGGTGPYLFSIDGGQSFQSENVFSDLPNGIYEIVVVDENSCAYGTTVMIDFTGVDDASQNLEFDVLPNPSDGLFTLRMNLPAPGKLQLSIFDVAGRLVFRQSIPASGRVEAQIDLRFLANGSYQLRVNDEKTWGVKRLVITR